MAPPSYLRVRAKHLAFSLKSLTKRQQNAIVAIAILLGPAVLGAIHLISSAVEEVVVPDSRVGHRFLFYVIWLTVSTTIVLTLREPVFMLRARDFIRALPISRREHFLGDLASSAAVYSFLWAPVIYFEWRLWSMPGTTIFKFGTTAAVAIGVVLGLILQVMVMHLTVRAAALLLCAVVFYCVAPSLGQFSWAAYLATLALAAWSVILDFERRPLSPAPLGMSAGFRPPGGIIAVQSGLALPVLLHDLRPAFMLRIAIVVTSLCLFAWLAMEGSFCLKSWGAFLVQSGIVVLALHRLPATVIERLSQAMPFLYRLRAARVRSHIATYAVIVSLFIAAAAVAAVGWRGFCGVAAIDLGRFWWSSVTFGVALCGLGLFAFKHHNSSTWVGIVTVIVVAILLSQLL